MLNYTQERAMYADFTEPYFRDPNVLVTRVELKDTLKGYPDFRDHTLAVIKGYMQEEYLRTHFPNINTLPVNSELEGLQAVSRGDADALSGSLLAMTYHIQKLGLSNLHIAADLPRSDELRMAVAKGDTVLLSILNQALRHISHQQHAEIYRRWNPISITRQPDYTLAWQIGALAILFLGILGERYWSVKILNRKLEESNQKLQIIKAQLQLKNEHLTHLSRYDSLTGTLNRRAMRELADEELQRSERYHNRLSLMVLDLDKFKAINDTYGHNTGDEVLRDFAYRINNCLRETDKLARWGGEEFLILCQHKNSKDAPILAQRIMDAIHAPGTKSLPAYRCSIGYADHQKGETFEQWFERADLALYSAKKLGGDQYQPAS